jgi:hypothetical protein
MSIETTTTIAPLYWACYLINGDSGDMSDAEIKTCDRWVAELGPWYVVDVARDRDGEAKESWFTWSYTYGPKGVCGGDVCEYVIHRQKRRYVRKAVRS